MKSRTAIVNDALKVLGATNKLLGSMKYVPSEQDIEDYLVKRVKEERGFSRKVKWQGRNYAPDRRCGLPKRGVLAARAFWVEVKEPGGLATFPKDARERGQYREHHRMRRCGERVVVIDSFAGVDEELAR